MAAGLKLIVNATAANWLNKDCLLHSTVIRWLLLILVYWWICLDCFRSVYMAAAADYFSLLINIIVSCSISFNFRLGTSLKYKNIKIWCRPWEAGDHWLSVSNQQMFDIFPKWLKQSVIEMVADGLYFEQIIDFTLQRCIQKWQLIGPIVHLP